MKLKIKRREIEKTIVVWFDNKSYEVNYNRWQVIKKSIPMPELIENEYSLKEWKWRREDQTELLKKDLYRKIYELQINKKLN
jgi:hypothetical protein